MALTVCVAMLVASTALAQVQPAPAAPPAKPAPAAPLAKPAQAAVPTPPAPPPPPGAPVNVRIDIAVIDEGGPQTERERVTLTTVDRQEASVRSDAEVTVPGSMPRVVILNVDATPFVSGLPAGKVRVRVGLDYLPDFTGAKQRGARTRLQFTVIVDDGKMIVASETSDPATDRRVRVEVTATMLK